MTRVVLASASPRRRDLLAALLDGFEVVPSEVTEPDVDDAVAGAVELARAKAVAVAREAGEAVVIGADTVVHDGTRSFAKPTSRADAVAMLRSLRGREHQVVTGLAVAGGGAVITSYSAARVWLRDFEEVEIAEYVRSGRPMDKAGAYAIQDEDVPTVERLEGCYCCVVGLPLWKLRTLLESVGVGCKRPEAQLPRCAVCPDRP